jgi:uncharacterized protein (DUF2237 family)
MQCRYGSQHHSFIFLGGQFMGNGFDFNIHSRQAEFGQESVFRPLALAAHVPQTCPFIGLQNLVGGSLRSCTQSNDRMNTGWTRSGSCNWAANDQGYHEVCVEMSQEFLQRSASVDGNDLSSVVQRGGHWCICAWAFASAVTAATTQELQSGDPNGLRLQCDATNGKLRDVYSHFATLQSPTHHSYLSVNALQLVDRLCPDATQVSVQNTTATVTDDVTSTGSDPCYILANSQVTFPMFEGVCPELNPLPAICGASQANVPSCATAYMRWWGQCATDAFVQQLDTQMNGAFTTFSHTCTPAYQAVLAGQH